MCKWINNNTFLAISDFVDKRFLDNFAFGRLRTSSEDFRLLRKTSDFFGNLRKWSCRLQKSQNSQDKNLMLISQKKLAGVQSHLPILSEIPWRKSFWSQFKVLTAGRLGTRRKVPESSSRLYGLSNVMVSLSLSNRPSLKTLAFASSDSPKSSIKIPYPERNTVEKKSMVTV